MHIDLKSIITVIPFRARSTSLAKNMKEKTKNLTLVPKNSMMVKIKKS